MQQSASLTISGQMRPQVVALCLILRVITGLASGAGMPQGGVGGRVTWDVTPVGSMPVECVHQVPSGAHVSELPRRVFGVKLANGHAFEAPVCNMKRLRRTRFRQSEHGPDWSKWQLAAQAQSVDLDGFDKFETSIRAPNLPSRGASPLQVVAGTQNQPFMPLFNETRGRPKGPFNLFGAALRYPSSVEGWGVSLWFSTWTSGAVFTTERALHPGQRADVLIQRIGPRTWKAKVTVRETKEFLELAMTNPRLQIQPWASMSLSGGGLRSCGQLPRGPVDFEATRLFNDRVRDPAAWLPAVGPWPACEPRVWSSGDTVAMGLPDAAVH